MNLSRSGLGFLTHSYVASTKAKVIKYKAANISRADISENILFNNKMQKG